MMLSSCERFNQNTLPRKPRVNTGRLNMDKAPRRANVIDSYGYRRKIFNLIRELQSMILHTHVQNSTKQGLVDQLELSKSQAICAMTDIIPLLTKICEFDVNYKRSERLTLIRLYEQTCNTQNTSVTLKTKNVGEIDLSPSNSVTNSSLGMMSSQPEKITNVEDSLFDILMQHDFNDD
jgi:hypothetical protein